MAEEDDLLQDADALAEAIGGGLADESDPLAEEMLKAMESGEGGGAAAVAPPAGEGLPPNIARLMDVRLLVTIELGRTRKTVQEVLDLGEQSLLELDKSVGEPVNVMVNGHLFARGEVVTVSENFGVRITELVSPLATGL
ncbi:MAG: flagellar motor switch protein FliN [Candidatus Handelsmanbacteria bacterium]|nr:flagellar motor switch protein FliN [Candidatus Handelsmanbacteria bacterium]